jgi:hypothetical protein
MKRTDPAADDAAQQLVARHLRIGWWSLLAFLSLGIVLEALHGLKVGWYLDVANETRRLMFTLGHAHGTLLALVHVAFAVSLPRLPAFAPRRRALASACLAGAGLLLPTGFLLGGLYTHAGDPGLGVLLVPPGAILLLFAVWLSAAEPQPNGGARARAPPRSFQRSAVGIQPQTVGPRAPQAMSWLGPGKALRILERASRIAAPEARCARESRYRLRTPWAWIGLRAMASSSACCSSSPGTSRPCLRCTYRRRLASRRPRRFPPRATSATTCSRAVSLRRRRARNATG